eukprot:TRINITY_DN5908_c0_g1_i2.p1 TRINITY_DN5908_c0_g1~~TRINITY_DN5908_c0_g1_i2.p1  ORF type:complete len:348 (-),score=50.83 TRINITY_DN5908_c0_g1_i2:26-1069(-)
MEKRVSFLSFLFFFLFFDSSFLCSSRFTQPGQWTDDASMMLCFADSLIAKGQFDPIDLRLRFHNWWTHGYNNAFCNCSPKRHSVGLGGNISMSMGEFETHPCPFTKAGDESTSGNGSLMRNCPAAIFYGNSGTIEQAMELASLQSLTTHQGKEAAECCRLHALLMTTAIREGASLEASFKKEDIGEIPPGTTVKTFLDRVCSSFKSTLPSVQNLALSIPDKIGSEVDRNRNWRWKSEQFYYSPEREFHNAGYIGSYAMDALAMSLHCIYYTPTLEEAMLKTANLRGDADTVCAIAGQIAGAIYGYQRIPKEWVKAVEQWEPVPGDSALRAYKLFHRHCLNQPALQLE